MLTIFLKKELFLFKKNKGRISLSKWENNFVKKYSNNPPINLLTEYISEQNLEFAMGFDISIFKEIFLV